MGLVEQHNSNEIPNPVPDVKNQSGMEHFVKYRVNFWVNKFFKILIKSVMQMLENAEIRIISKWTCTANTLSFSKIPSAGALTRLYYTVVIS